MLSRSFLLTPAARLHSQKNAIETWPELIWLSQNIGIKMHIMSA